MNDISADRKLLLAYLLGELSPEKREEVEARMLADQTFSDCLQEAEYDLIDDYHAGRLTADERRRAEGALSTEGLSRASGLRPARAVQDAARQKIPVFNRRGSPLWLAAIAASFILLSAGWLFLSRGHRRAVPTNSSDRSPVPAKPGDPGTPSLAGSQSRSQAHTTIALILPTVTRGPASAALQLRPSTHAIQVQWVVPPSLTASRFRLVITAGGKTVAETPQSGDIRKIEGSDVAEFQLNPALFRKTSGRMIFQVWTEGSPAVVETQIAVTVSSSSN